MIFLTKKPNSQQTSSVKRLLIRGLSLGLCLSMGLSVVACSKTNDSNGSDKNGGATGQGAYFLPKELEIYQPAADESFYIYSSVLCKDKIAVLTQIYSGGGGGEPVIPMEKDLEASQPADESDTSVADQATDETIQPIAEASTSAAGTDETTTSGQESTENADASTGEAIPSDGNGDINTMMKNIIFFFDFDGNKLSEIDLAEYIKPDGNLMSMTADGDGTLYILSSGPYVESTDVAKDQELTLNRFDNTGAPIDSAITLSVPANTYLSKMVVDPKGNIYALGYGETSQVFVFDNQGKNLFELKEDKLQQNIFAVGDQVYVDAADYSTEKYSYMLYPIQLDQKAFGDSIKMDDVANMGGANITGGKDGIYFNDSYGVYFVNLTTKEKKTILLWKDSDIKRANMGGEQVIVLSDDKIFLQTMTEDGSSLLMILTRQDKNPNEGKKIITIGGLWLSSDTNLQSAIYKFNTTNKEYRINIRDYAAESTAQSNGDYLAIYKQMNMEILSGSGPDIITGSFGGFSRYASKGVLLDLYTLMDKDPNFKKDDYLENIMKLGESDGKLYQLCTSFSLSGLAGAKSVIGDRTGWTIEEFEKMASSLPAKMKPLANYSQSNLFFSSIMPSLDNFVDTKNNKANFDTPAFYELLEFSKKYGTPDSQINGNGEDYKDEAELIKNGELALTSGAYVGSPTSYNNLVAMFGEPISVVGYPTINKNPPACSPGLILAITSASKETAAAWDFVKTFLNEENQKAFSQYMQIPVLKSVFEAQIEVAKNPPEEGDPASETRAMMMGGYYGDSSQPMTAESVQAYRDLINGVKAFAEYDDDVYNIIFEEVPAYFSGDKTAQQVAQVLQNRVQTVLDER